MTIRVPLGPNANAFYADHTTQVTTRDRGDVEAQNLIQGDWIELHEGHPFVEVTSAPVTE